MVYEIVLNATLNSQQLLTVLHYDIDGGDPINFQALADAIRVHLVDNLQTWLVPTCTYTGITIREDIPGTVGVTYPFTLGNLVGSDANTDSFNQMAMLVRKNCNSTVRPNRGRVFQGGLTSEGTDGNGLWQTDVRNAVAAFWSDMITIAFAGPATAQLVVKASKPTAPNTVPYNPVTTVGTISNPTTQRRRRIGVGA